MRGDAIVIVHAIGIVGDWSRRIGSCHEIIGGVVGRGDAEIGRRHDGEGVVSGSQVVNVIRDSEKIRVAATKPKKKGKESSGATTTPATMHSKRWQLCWAKLHMTSPTRPSQGCHSIHIPTTSWFW